MGTPDEDLGREVRRLQERLEGVEDALGEVRARLAALELSGERRAPLPPPPPVPAPAPPVAPRPPPAAPPSVPGASAPPAAPRPASVTASPPARPGPAPTSWRELPDNWLTEVALKWVAPRVAAVALILAAIFALQWAIQNHRLSPTEQVALGVLAGLVLLVLGDRHVRKQRQTLGEALLGTGIALLYVAIYAAYAAFRPPLLGYVPAFIGLALVTAIAVGLALRNDAQSTALLATFGGFLTPKLLQGTGGTAGMSDLVGLFVYVIILDLGLLTASLYRRWRPLQALCFVATWVLLWTWLGNTPDPNLRYATAVPALALFAIFLLVPVLWNLRLRQPTEAIDLSLILANPSCFCPTAAFLVAIHHREWLGAMAVGLGVLYLLLGEVTRRRNPDDRLLYGSWLSLGLVLITVAIPLQFRGEWTMIAWGLEGALLVWVGLQARSYTVRALGLVLQSVVFGWLLLLYRLADPLPAGVLPFANTLFMSYLAGALTIALSLLLYARGDVPAEESRPNVGALSVGVIVLSVAGVSYELWRLDLPMHIHLLWWSVAAALVMAIGHLGRNYTVRVAGLLFDGALVLFMAMLYSFRPEPVWLPSRTPILNEVFLVFLLGLGSLAVAAVLYGRSGLKTAEAAFACRALPLALAVLGLWGLTADVSRGLHELAREYPRLHGVRGFGISLLWCLYAAGLVCYSLARRRVEVRLAGVIVFGLAVLKVFLVDTWQLEAVWRALSYACLAGLLLAVSYLYLLHREQLQALLTGEEEAPPAPPDDHPSA